VGQNSIWTDISLQKNDVELETHTETKKDQNDNDNDDDDKKQTETKHKHIWCKDIALSLSFDLMD